MSRLFAMYNDNQPDFFFFVFIFKENRKFRTKVKITQKEFFKWLEENNQNEIAVRKCEKKNI